MKKTNVELEKDALQMHFEFEDIEERHAVVLEGLPMPPSSNHQYKLFRRNGKTYHVPSTELKTFKAAITHYTLKNSSQYLACLNLISQWRKEKHLFHCNATFYFKKPRIFTLKGEPRKIDVSNRIKAIHDSVSQMLHLDDSYFFSIGAKKLICKEGDEEHVTIEIFPHTDH